ncbi:NIC-domain-containing protein, partial [Coemansia reversa NRRL 1564]
MTQNHSLSSLLEDSKRLTTHLTLAEIPAVQRGIDLLEAESRKLVARSVRNGIIDPRAQTFLASSGIDADDLADSVAPVALLSAFEQLQPSFDANVESFLSQQHEQSIVNAIEESELSTLDDFDSGMNSYMQNIWEENQRRLFEELGQYHGYSSKDSRAFPLAFVNQEDGLSDTFALNTKNAFDLDSENAMNVTQPRVERYAQVIRGFNDARVVAATRTIAATPQYDLLKGLENATTESARELKSRQIGQVWSLLAHYCDTKDNTRIASGACAYLEETFAEHVDRIIAQYPHDANVGGIPSIHRKVRGFLDVLFGRLGRVPQFLEVFNSEAIWAHMFVLYRCGHRQELLKYALEMEDIITDSDPGFVAHLKAFLDRASATSSTRSDIPITSSSSSLEDPYKAALYKVLGRGNVPKKATQEVIQTTEDYLWTNLVLIRDADIIAVASGHPRNTLDSLQTLMLKFGAAHFDPNGNNPLLYLRVLLLCGLFENAVDYLLQIDRYQIEAVHMAIMLAFAGLLRVAETETSGSFSSYLVSDNNAAVPRLDFARILIHYARALPDSMTENAVHYLLLLTLPILNNGDSNTDTDETGVFRKRVVCEQAIVRLMYERREYAHFIGDIQSDGMRKPGFIERYLPLLGITSSEQFSQTIIRRLADRSRDEGRLADTVLLYNLGERYNTVLNVLCKQLGELLYLRGSTNGNSGNAATAVSSQDYSAPIQMGLGLDDVEGVARAVLTHYRQHDHIARVLDNAAVNTCTTLLAIMDFLNSHRRGAYEEALEIIEATQLLPLAAPSTKVNDSSTVVNTMNNSDIAMATQYAERVRTLDDSITRNFSLVLLSTMDTLSRLYAGLKESMFLDAIKQANMQILRKKARTLMVFAGMIQFRMPSDTYAKLNRMDVFM